MVRPITTHKSECFIMQPHRLRTTMISKLQNFIQYFQTNWLAAQILSFYEFAKL
jgi:hypothetical protein